MTPINIHDMHHHLERLGIPIRSVQLNPGGKTVSLLFALSVTDEQQVAAFKIADEWDQAAFDKDKATAFDNLPTVEAITNTKAVKDLQAMALQLRAYIDARRHSA